MTSIGSTTSSTAIWSSQQFRQSRSGGDQGGPLQSVSSLLGTSVDDLRTELAGGRSLDDIADDRGVSHDDLVSALESGMPDGLTAGAGATEVAEQMAAQAGGPKAATPPAGATAGGSAGSETGVLTGSVTDRQQSRLDQLSDLLDTDSDDLVAELQGGTTLLQILSERGITQSSAASTVGEGFLFDTRG